MRNCKKCQWYVSRSCKKRRDEDGDPIEVDPEDVCDKFTRPHCGSCRFRGDDGCCICKYNDLGNHVWVNPNDVCDRFFLDDDGYRSSGSSQSSGCYLTSACVDYYQKEDDCYELTTLRKLRDERLVYMEGGKELIEQYYEIAPQIVEKIDGSEKRGAYYQYIYDRILACIDGYNQGDFAKSIDVYKEMVEYLKKELL